MNTKQKHGLLNKVIAILLVITMTCVYVVGDSYAPVIVERNKHESTDLLSQTLSYSTDVMPNFELKDVSELVLAKSTTNMGKASQSLLEAYADMPRTVKNSSELESSVSYFKEQIANLKGQSFKELIKADNGTEEFNVYKNAVTAGYAQLEELLSGVNADNYEEVMADVSALINPERPYVSLADDLPFNDVSEDNISYSAYNPESVETYQINDGSYSDDDLKQTNDTIINDEVRAEFTDLASVLEVYQYIKNNYTMEFYFGSRKGAVGTSAEKAGNDYDIASLLIGVLRDRNIPARYAKGEIEITAEQAMEWTATDDINVAMHVISALGIPTTGMVSNGETIAVRLEHVWVEAYVPYTDYRGTGNRSGERMWIPLDASFKKLHYHEGINLLELEEYMNDESNFLNADSKIFEVNVGGIASVFEDESSAAIKYLIENGYSQSSKEEVFGGREIIYEDLGYLPLTLPYNVFNTIDSFSDIPDNLTDSIAISLVGNSAFALNFDGKESLNYTLYAPDVYGKRIILSYAPATDEDEELLSQYGDLFSTPAYLLKLKPQLIIDGEIIAEGGVCNAGYMQKYTLTVCNGSPYTNDGVVDNAIIAGGMYCIALDYGSISSQSLLDAANNMDSLKETMNDSNIYTDAVMGEMLDGIAKAYFAQLDLYNFVLEGQNNVTATRDLSIGIVGYNLNVVYTFNRPAELNEGGIFLDIGRDVQSVISNDNNSENEKNYMLQSGMYASAMEHVVLEQVTGIESVSTIKAFQYAVENNIPIHAITKENLSDEILAINVSEQVKQEIRSAVNSGKIVIIPEREVCINQWSGIGYMVLDTGTYACGYMISGGLAGGAMAWYEVIGAVVKNVATGLAIGAVALGACVGLTMIFPAIAPVLAVALKIIGCIGAFAAGLSIGTHIYNFIETGNVREFQDGMIELASFGFLVGIGSKLESLFKSPSGSSTADDAVQKADDALKAADDALEVADDAAKEVDEAIKGGACFVAGTLVSTPNGLIPIETISSGDIVYSFNPETCVISTNEVEDTFIRKSSELVHIEVSNTTITSTQDHPFYVPQKGFVNAIELRAGDILLSLDGNYVVVEQIQHEILESPIEVFNFRVSNDHTYYVGRTKIAVHNANCGPNDPLPNQGTVNGDVEGAPNVDAGKQGKHVIGHNNCKNPNKSMWTKGSNGVTETQQGWVNGTQLPDGTRVWDTGKIVGANGETGVRVHIDGNGNIHGYPVNPSQYLKGVT